MASDCAHGSWAQSLDGDWYHSYTMAWYNCDTVIDVIYSASEHQRNFPYHSLRPVIVPMVHGHNPQSLDGDWYHSYTMAWYNCDTVIDVIYSATISASEHQRNF